LGGRTTSAAEILARTGSKAPRDIRPTDVGPRVLDAAARIQALRADLDHAHRMTQEAQVREALSRSELAVALNATLKAHAADRLQARRAAAALYALRHPPRPLAAQGRLARWRRAALLRLGAGGEARLLADNGLWPEDHLDSAIAYVRRRADPAARPAVLFDQDWYLRHYPDAASYGRAPLTHYLLHGAARGVDPHPLFSTPWYLTRNGEALRGTGATPLAHFLARGAASGCDPHPLFSLSHYFAQEPDLAAGEDPVSHYIRAGWRDGLSPHPLFDSAWYRRQAPDVDTAEVPPLIHYVTQGWREGRSPHPLFDPAWYLEQNPDIAESGREPLAHFVTSGAAEGRNPGPWFDIAHYRAARGEGLAPGANPLVDYLEGGAWSVVEAKPGLPTAAYLAAAPEIVAGGMTPLEHWARRSAGAD
jgi:hypothetical protein